MCASFSLSLSLSLSPSLSLSLPLSPRVELLVSVLLSRVVWLLQLLSSSLVGGGAQVDEYILPSASIFTRRSAGDPMGGGCECWPRGTAFEFTLLGTLSCVWERIACKHSKAAVAAAGRMLPGVCTSRGRWLVLSAPCRLFGAKLCSALLRILFYTSCTSTN